MPKVEEIAWKEEANIKRRFPMEENEVPKLQIAHLCKQCLFEHFPVQFVAFCVALYRRMFPKKIFCSSAMYFADAECSSHSIQK